MKKQIISAVMAVGMLASCIPGVMAERYSEKGSKWTFTNIGGAQGMYEIQKEETFGGEAALHLKASEGDGYSCYSIELPTGIGETFNYSFYLKEKTASSDSFAAVGMENAVGGNDEENTKLEVSAEGTRWKKTPVGNGWYKYEQSFWRENVTHFNIVVKNGAEYYFDNIIIKSIDQNRVLVSDDFETSTEVEDIKWRMMDTTSQFSVVEEDNGNHYWRFTGPSQVRRVANVKQFTGGNDYYVKIRAKITGFPNGLYFGINNNAKFNILNWTKSEPDENGWCTYETTYNWWFEKDLMFGSFGIWVPWNSTDSELLIDDIFVKCTSNNVVVLNEDCEPSVHYEYPNELSDLSANGYNNNIVLTWKNPNRSDISGFKVYENDTEVTADGTIATSAGAYNMLNITPGDTNVHTYRVEMTTTSGETYNTSVSGKSDAFFLSSHSTMDGYPLFGSYLTYETHSGTVPYGSVRIDKLNKYSGNSALKVKLVQGTWEDNIKLQLGGLGLQTGKTYKLSYMVKSNGDLLRNNYRESTLRNAYTSAVQSDGTIGILMSPFITNINDAAGWLNYNKINTKWQKREFVFTAGADGEIYFVFSGPVDSIWLDDITLYEYDKDTNTTLGLNLLPNGGFEYKVDNLNLDGNKLTWSVPEGANFKYIQILTVANGMLVNSERVDPSAGEHILGDATASSEQIYVQAIMMNGSVENELDLGSFERTSDVYVKTPTYDAVSLNADETYETLESDIKTIRSGLVRSNVTVKNNKLIDCSLDVYTALYNGDKLVKVEKTVAEPEKGAQITVGSVIDIPEEATSEYKIKTFVFQGGTIIPQIKAKTLGKTIQ